MDVEILTRMTQLRQTMVKPESNNRISRSIEGKSGLMRDSVSISRYPKELRKYNALISQEMNQLEERVQEIKQELKDGTYRIDTEAIVNALIEY